MAKYAFPAIFTKEDKGMYSVHFPDLEGCYTCGENLPEALHMAEDVLAFTLYDYEKSKTDIPTPSEMNSIQISDDEFVNMVYCDTIGYQ